MLYNVCLIIIVEIDDKGTNYFSYTQARVTFLINLFVLSCIYAIFVVSLQPKS